MKRWKFIKCIGGAAVIAASQSPAVAQSFSTYHCRDGAEFVVAFVGGDRSAHLQLDGKAVTLPRRLSLSGKRYASGNTALTITKAITSLKRGSRLTECTTE
jgi:membrane-bound inhibitor of C-type lysozyme